MAMTKDELRALSVRAIVALYREFERVARDSDISLAQYRTMLYLRSGAKRAGAIAAAGAVKKPTISAMLANLREKGWISGETDPADGRALSVKLTKAGLKRMATFEATLAARVAEVAPSVDLGRFHAALAEVYAGMAESREERGRDIASRFLE
jgi:DNA-binding MarR family transcriptional regulator